MENNTSSNHTKLDSLNSKDKTQGKGLSNEKNTQTMGRNVYGVSSEDLKQRYESLNDDELIKLYTNSKLTDLASSVLIQILKARCISPENLVKQDLEKAKEIEDEKREAALESYVPWIRQKKGMDNNLEILPKRETVIKYFRISLLITPIAGFLGPFYPCTVFGWIMFFLGFFFVFYNIFDDI